MKRLMLLSIVLSFSLGSAAYAQNSKKQAAPKKKSSEKKTSETPSKDKKVSLSGNRPSSDLPDRAIIFKPDFPQDPHPEIRFIEALPKAKDTTAQ
jgi:hypothetical protein